MVLCATGEEYAQVANAITAEKRIECILVMEEGSGQIVIAALICGIEMTGSSNARLWLYRGSF